MALLLIEHKYNPWEKAKVLAHNYYASAWVMNIVFRDPLAMALTVSPTNKGWIYCLIYLGRFKFFLISRLLPRTDIQPEI